MRQDGVKSDAAAAPARPEAAPADEPDNECPFAVAVDVDGPGGVPSAALAAIVKAFEGAPPLGLLAENLASSRRWVLPPGGAPG
jgi:hypothetical protein